MAAQDAELKLKVSLDLAFFRAQLSRLPIEAAGYTAPINLKINNKSIADEFKRVSNYLGRKEYKIKITSETLEKLTEKVGKFQKQLQLLKDEKIAVDVQASVSVASIDQKQARKIRTQIKQDILSQGGKIQLETELAAPATSSFVADTRKKVKEQLGKTYASGAIPVETQLKLPGVSDFLKAIQKNLNRNPLRVVAQVEQRATTKAGVISQTKTSSADAPVRTFRQELLGIGDISKIQDIYKAAAKQGLLAFDEGIINNKRKMIDALAGAARDAGQGFLDAFASEKSALSKAAAEYGQTLLRSLKKTLRSASPSLEMWDIGHDAGKGFELGLLEALEIAEKSAVRQTRSMLDRLARMVLMMSGMSGAAINQQVRDMRGLKPVSFPSSVPQKDIPIGPSGTGRALPPANMQALAGLISGARPPAGLLPSITPRSSIKSGIETLFAAGGPQFPMGPSGKLAMSAEALKARVDKILTDYFKVVEVTIKEVFTQEDLKRELNRFSYLPQALRDAELRTKQARVGIPAAQGIAGLLPSAVGRAPNVYATGAIGGESRQQMMARRTAEAYARSALRGASVLSERQTVLPGTTFMGDAFVSGGGRDRVTGSGKAPERGGALAFPGGAMGQATQLSSSYMALGKLSAELQKSQEFFNKSKIPLASAVEELAGEFGNAAKQVLLYGTAYKALAFFTNLPAQAFNAAKSLETFNNQLNAITGSAANADKAFTFVDNIATRFNVPLESARQGFVKLYASMAPAGFSSGQIENLFTGITKASATLGLSADKVDRVTYAFSQMASKGQLMSEEVSGQLGDVIPGALSIMAEAARMDIATFKKAMEDGVFIGETFQQVMSNVPIVLENRFGKGAAGAANTLQGSLTSLTNATTKFYEAFQGIISLGASQVFPLIAGAVDDATMAVKAFSSSLDGSQTSARMLTGNAKNIYDGLQRLKEIFTAIQNIVAGLLPTLSTLGNVLLVTGGAMASLANNPAGRFLVDFAIKAGIATIAIQLLSKTAIAGFIAQLLLMIRNVQAAGTGLLGLVNALANTATAAKLARFAIIGITGALILSGIEAVTTAIGKMATRLDDARKNAIAAKDAIKGMSFAQLGEQKITVEENLRALNRAQRAGGLVNDPKDIARLKGMGMNVAEMGTFRRFGKVDPMLIEGFRQVQLEQLTQIQGQQKTMYDAGPAPLGEVDITAGKPTEEKGKTKSLEDLIGGNIERNLNEAKAALRELVAKRLGEAAGDQDAERMIKYFEKHREIRLEIQAINETIRKVEEEMPTLIKLGIDPAEKIAELRSKEIVLLYDLQTAVQEQTNEAKKAADERAKQLRDYEETINNIRIENGLVSAEQAVQIKLAQQYQKIIEQFPFLREEEKKQVKALLADNQKQLRTVREEIELLRAVSDIEQRRIELRREGYSDQRIQEILDLEKIRDNIKAVRELIDSFVTDTTSDYKNFLGEIISGKDAGDALREFQKSLKDRVLKIFLDFSMAPVEKFFKESLGQFALDKLFPKADIEKIPEETKKETALEANTAALNRLTDAITTPAVSPDVPQAPGNGPVAIPVIPFGANETTETLAQTFANDASLFASSISSVDSSLKDATISIANAAEEASPNGATGKKWQQSLGAAVQGIGIAAGSIMGIMAGIQQVKEGGTSNVLGGIGSILLSVGGAIGGLSSLGGLFGGGASAAGDVAGNLAKAPFAPKLGPVFANGGIAKGGFRAFANGGIVQGPTLGLVGEGRYNEAVVPLPNGKSIPVQLGGRTARDLMGGNAPGMPQQTSFNMSFETTKINGVEYVSRDQLEQAMAETRRASISGGARQGMAMTLDKIRQSPSTRSRIGMR